MEEKDILFGSIISLLAQSFLPHFGIMVSEPLVLYELAKRKEKRAKKGDKRKRFSRTKMLSSQILSSQILSSQILSSQILSSQILRSQILSSQILSSFILMSSSLRWTILCFSILKPSIPILSFSKRSIQFRRLDRISIRQDFKIVR